MRGTTKSSPQVCWTRIRREFSICSSALAAIEPGPRRRPKARQKVDLTPGSCSQPGTGPFTGNWKWLGVLVQHHRTASGCLSVTESSSRSRPTWSIMTTLAAPAHPLYCLEDLIEKRRDVLRYARMYPPGVERNRHREVAASLRVLFRNKNWLATNTNQG
jgi:hypothetical protein